MSNILSILLDFSVFVLLIYNVFIKMHEYLKYNFFNNYHKVKVLCLSITLILDVVL